MMSTRSLRAAVAAGGAALVLLLTGCTDSGSTEDAGASATHDHGSMSQQADPAADHNDADVSFAAGMVPHHQQAIEMSDIILAKQGIDQRVVDLANQIKAAQGPEIATMQQWLTGWGAPAMNHEGHDMSDMGRLAHLAMNPREDASREEIYLAIASLYRVQGNNLNNRERELMREILRRLTRDVEMAIRIALAERLADFVQRPSMQLVRMICELFNGQFQPGRADEPASAGLIQLKLVRSSSPH